MVTVLIDTSVCPAAAFGSYPKLMPVPLSVTTLGTVAVRDATRTFHLPVGCTRTLPLSRPNTSTPR